MWRYDYDYISHGWFNKKPKDRDDHKYIDKYQSKKGNWIYVYKEKVGNALKNAGNKIVTAAKNVGEVITKKAPKVITDAIQWDVDQLDKAYSKAFNNNKYMIRSWNYDNKVKQVKGEPEWQKIKSHKDPEYCKKVTDENGKTTWKYDIDSYIMKKKHPFLDIFDDIANGRDVTLNDVSYDTLIAGADDYFQAGLAYIGLRAGLLGTAFKYRQGSYGDEQANIEETIQNGMKVVNQLAKAYDENQSEIDKLLNAYSTNVDLNKEIQNAANKISSFAEQQNVSIDTILEQPSIKEYLAKNGMSDDMIRKYAEELQHSDIPYGRTSSSYKLKLTPKRDYILKKDSKYKYTSKYKTSSGNWVYVYDDKWGNRQHTQITTAQQNERKKLKPTETYKKLQDPKVDDAYKEFLKTQAYNRQQEYENMKQYQKDTKPYRDAIAKNDTDKKVAELEGRRNIDKFSSDIHAVPGDEFKTGTAAYKGAKSNDLNDRTKLENTRKMLKEATQRQAARASAKDAQEGADKARGEASGGVVDAAVASQYAREKAIQNAAKQTQKQNEYNKKATTAAVDAEWERKQAGKSTSEKMQNIVNTYSLYNPKGESATVIQQNMIEKMYDDYQKNAEKTHTDAYVEKIVKEYKKKLGGDKWYYNGKDLDDVLTRWVKDYIKIRDNIANLEVKPIEVKPINTYENSITIPETKLYEDVLNEEILREEILKERRTK